MATSYVREGEALVKVTNIGRFRLKEGGAEHAKALRWLERNAGEKPAPKASDEQPGEVTEEDEADLSTSLGLAIALTLAVGAAVAALIFRRRNAPTEGVEEQP